MSALRVSVAGIAVEGQKLFIARRKPGGDLGGKWEFPGGKTEKGESDQAALVREFQEEFGIAVETGAFLGSAVFEHRGAAYDLHAYRIFFTPQPFRPAEHTEWRWAGLEELETLDFAGSDRLLFPLLKTYLEGQA
ncbi:MAG: (deoxy)nucleoside triphosphate pyrophosphohydrolase [Treponema sp.]|jgi:8-oxo-dGTP diphosphatase|nr:(deoxy)nucleoside triphosphate pyrophosphohydrolase [Treponema sp.]